MDTFKTILTGLGNIGRTFLELLVADSERFALRYGFQLRIIGVADSTGVAFDPDGLDLPAIIDCSVVGLVYECYQRSDRNSIRLILHELLIMICY
jgi:homoserine dehydrogenase (EC 1.1.1.3)